MFLLATIITYLWQGKILDYHEIPIQFAFYLLLVINIYNFSNELMTIFFKYKNNNENNLIGIFIWLFIIILFPLITSYGHIDKIN